MEWSTTNNVQNERIAFMRSQRLEPNFSDLLGSFDYDFYAGNSSTHVTMQTGPVVSVSELENITNADQCPSNNKEMLRKKKALTSEQLASLEQSFLEDSRLDVDKKLKLSKELGLQPSQVAVWFQNRRARKKVKHLEESYDMLRLKYEVVCRENQMLQDEMKKLKDIILKDHGFMKTHTNLDSHHTNGTGSMMVASSFLRTADIAAALPVRESLT